VIMQYRERALVQTRADDDGEAVDLPSSPILSPQQIIAARHRHMRRLRRAGYSVAIVAEYFNCSEIHVKRVTGIPRGVRLADGRS
jgi:hypothetical protein